MYNEYFGLTDTPFSIAPDPRYLYMSDQHREALAHLVFGMSTGGGFILLTGEVGTGKTTVCRCLLEQVPENANVALILNPKVKAYELLATICDELGIEYPKGETSIKALVDCINRYLLDEYARGRKTVVILEEAQNLDADVLEQLRLLTNLETNEHKLLQIVMLGQPELLDMLASPKMSQLSQRITARYHLKALPRKEVDAYVNHRLSVAGLHRILFPESTLNLLYRLSGGIPRRINLLCDRALLGAYVNGRHQVDSKILKKAAREVLGEGGASFASRIRQVSIWWLVGSVMLISVVAFGLGMIVHQDSSGIGELLDVTGQQQSPSQALVRNHNANIIASEKKHLSENPVAMPGIQVSKKGKIRRLPDTKQGVSGLPELVPSSSSTVSTDSR
ncbi:MAG: AAA family ATPase [Gammaproteobacteria bacterium]|nr:AAA family ATPase [Gammaproteobacteria bacterium]